MLEASAPAGAPVGSRNDSAQQAPSKAHDQVRIYCLDLDVLDEPGLLSRIFGDLDQGLGGWVVTPNVEILRQASADPELQVLFSQATMRIADGAPVEWAAKLSGRDIPGRIPGASLFWTLAREAALRGRSVLLVGGLPTAGELAAKNLTDTLPDLVVGHYCPPMGFEDDPREMMALRREIRNHKPDLVYVGLGAPKQERLMSILHSEFPSTWFFGFGGAIDFAAELVPRAPEWMQREGLEWVFRLAVEPRRLARRYLVQGIPFTVRLLAWALQVRRGRGPAAALA